MPKTIEIEVYRFEELSEKAKDRVRYNEKAAIGYSRDDEALASMNALAKHFGGRMYDYSIDWFASSHSYARFEMPEDMEEEEIARRLGELGTFNPETLKGNGDCKLTGYCSDEDAIDGFRAEFFKQKKAGQIDLESLMQAAFKTWLKAAQDDCEHQYSDEALTENGEANDYWYEANGESRAA